MSDADYDAPVYDAPGVIQNIGSLLRGLRRQYSDSFIDLFSSERQDQLDYVNGLLAVMVSFVVVFVFWAFILFVLKFKGQEVGCASGRPFLAQRADMDEMPSTDDSDSFGSGFMHGKVAGATGTHQRQASKNVSSPKGLEDNYQTHAESVDSNPEEILNAHKPILKANPREYRTRFCFLMFGLVVLICIPLIMVYSFSPMEDVSDSSDTLLDWALDVLDQIVDAVDSIANATDGALASVESANLELETVCPNVQAEDIETVVGFDLNALITSVTDEYEDTVADARAEIAYYRDWIALLEDGVLSFEDSVDKAKEWLWVVPGIICAVSIVTVASMVGVLLAWKERSGRRIQAFLSYGLLPIMMVVAVLCWIIVCVSAFGTMVGADVCTASGAPNGSPDETFQQVLDVLFPDHDDTAYTMIQSYTNKCVGESPTAAIDELQVVVQDAITAIWRQVSLVGSIGSEEIMKQCGSNELENLLIIAREVANFLTEIRRSLESTSSALACPTINPVYAAAVHDTVCTDAVGAVAALFVMSVIIAVSIMGMLSLRASWLQNIEEEKVYHDESEVAENMILDEHEEYLAYISKYNHEWQEYRGFEERSMVQSEMGEDSYFEGEEEGSRSVGEGYNGSDEGSDITPITPNGLQVDVFHDISTDPRHADVLDTSVETLETKEDIPAASVPEVAARSQQILPPPSNPFQRVDSADDVIMVQATLVGDSRRSEQSAINSRESDPQSTNFFQRYGIDPGASARRKPPSPMATNNPPPPQAAQAASSESNEQHHLATDESRPTGSRRTRGALPSGRTFFKANTNSNFEVEVQLSNRPYSPYSTAGSDDIVEC